MFKKKPALSFQCFFKIVFLVRFSYFNFESRKVRLSEVYPLQMKKISGITPVLVVSIIGSLIFKSLGSFKVGVRRTKKNDPL